MPAPRRWKRKRHRAKPEHVGDLLCPELLADPMVDCDELNELLRDPTLLRENPPAAPATGRPGTAFDPDEERPRNRPDPAEPIPPESALARVAKLVGLAVAVAVLCVAFAAASITAQTDRAQISQNPAQPPILSVTGARALVGLVAPDSPVPAPDQPTTRAPASAAGPVSTTRTSALREDPPPAPKLTELTTTNPFMRPASKLRAVHAFYGRIEDSPDQALAMLGPDLLAPDREELMRSWQSIHDVMIQDVRSESGGMVRVVVTMLHGGQQIRLTQLLRIDDSTGLITEARLLSAQHSRVNQTTSGG